MSHAPSGKWLKALAAIALTVIVSLALFAVARISRLEALEIAWVEVNGVFERVTAEQIRATAAPHLESGFLSVEPAHVRQRVEQVPWVQSAAVEKRWPDTVAITVVEHQPFGLWTDGRLISASGGLFAVEGQSGLAGLPRFTGPDDQAVNMVAFYRQMQARLAVVGEQVADLELNERGSWKATTRNGAELTLGSDDPLERLDRFVRAWEGMEGDDQRYLASADLRYVNGFAARWVSTDVLDESDSIAIAHTAGHN